MSIQSQKTQIHWKYLMAMERDLEILSRYIEFDHANFNCYSIETARLLLSAASEVDVVCRQLCKIVNPKSTADNVNDYRDTLHGAYPDLASFKVEMPRFGLVQNPWSSWAKKGVVPKWWIAYNKTKHHRHTHFSLANLENALNAVAGLFVVTLYLYEADAESANLSPIAQILYPENAHWNGNTFTGYGTAPNYIL